MAAYLTTTFQRFGYMYPKLLKYCKLSDKVSSWHSVALRSIPVYSWGAVKRSNFYLFDVSINVDNVDLGYINFY